MSANNNARNDAKPPLGSSLVLYGLDERGKPRAACFAAKDATLARKAAGLMGLTVLPVSRAYRHREGRRKGGRVV